MRKIIRYLIRMSLVYDAKRKGKYWWELENEWKRIIDKEIANVFVDVDDDDDENPVCYDCDERIGRDGCGCFVNGEAH